MIAWFLSQFGGVLLAVLGGIVAVVVAMFKGRLDGAAKERAKHQKDQLDAYEQSLRDIANAANPDNRRLPDIDKDPRNRDT